MRESRIYNISRSDYTAVRSDITNGVNGFSLVPEGHFVLRIVLTEVQPSGEFSLHVDNYHHVLYFISGHGTLQIGDREHKIGSGLVAEIPAGTIHGYKNSGSENMTLITMNLRAHG